MNVSKFSQLASIYITVKKIGFLFQESLNFSYTYDSLIRTKSNLRR